MTLLADYQARYSDQVRANASRPQNSTETTIDTDQETRAAADAGADFSAICGVTYSSSNATHVTAATPLVFYKLLVFTAQADQAAYDAQLERLERWYKPILGRDRILPTTDSTLTPTEETAGGKPFSDRSHFDRYTSNAPGGDSALQERGRD